MPFSLSTYSAERLFRAIITIKKIIFSRGYAKPRNDYQLLWVRICKFVTYSDLNKIDNSTSDQLISTFQNNAGTVLFT